MTGPTFWTRLERLTLDDLETLRTGGVKREKSTLDFKRFGPPNDLVNAEGIGRDICAFANAMGGRIVLGAIEDGADGLDRFSGAEVASLKNIRATVRNATHAVQPPPSVTSKEIPLADGRVVVVVEIRPGIGGPYQHRGTYLLRSVDGTVPMPHSTVVHSVLATHAAGREGEALVASIDAVGAGLVMSPYPFGEGQRGFYLAAELRARYPLRSPLCDPLDDEADQAAELCRDAGFEPSKKREGIWARKMGDAPQVHRRLRVLFGGLADGVEFIGFGHLERSGHLVTKMFERQIDLLARLLFCWSPPLLVGVAVSLWANGGSDMRLVVTQKDELDADEPLGSIPPQLTFREDLTDELPVFELLEPGRVQQLAERAYRLLKLSLEPVSRA